jgi:hypothetical protein
MTHGNDLENIVESEKGTQQSKLHSQLRRPVGTLANVKKPRGPDGSRDLVIQALAISSRAIVGGLIKFRSLS